MDSLLLVAFGAALVMAVGWARRRFWSFKAQRPEDYVEGQPQFDLRRHLNGPIVCEGVIYGPMGRVTSRFVGEFEARWEGNTGVMTEHFRYDSGSTQDRVWYLSLGNDGRIRATAPDVVGTGTGMQMGSAVQLQYRIQLPEESGGHVLDTTDWMYLAPNGTIVNRSQFRKFGIQVAELVATMRPRNAANDPVRDAA
ncbi:DUF3833 domain-containing protein [Sedimentitalea arenosa]|jgi:hypothetical protein|uniref:DUF3833 domain-containing protein n=1 Tax=Sedimentitalea arenosa TaxID=2798803 RepID=A0A8J7IWE7_9RHOB|nr:DUF3833 domain-containing protein [Arenibacterium arenosum]MBJ6372807.1 DUF3833 domain-containing protein [Arenibacterium arenosum]